jgi:hypothetical protein
MKKTIFSIAALCCLVLQGRLDAQSRMISERRNNSSSQGTINAGQDVNISFAQNILSITNLQEDSYDRILVFNMQGSVILKQEIKVANTTVDLVPFNEGVYLLVLRSTGSMKEKTVKFVVRK